VRGRDVWLWAAAVSACQMVKALKKKVKTFINGTMCFVLQFRIGRKPCPRGLRPILGGMKDFMVNCPREKMIFRSL
jgi:hypothetical protein